MPKPALIAAFFLATACAKAPAPTPERTPRATGNTTSADVADFDVLLGPANDFTPAAFAALRAGMTPAEAASVLPGADAVDAYGFAKITAPKLSGGAQVDHVQLFYIEGLLSKASLGFKASLTHDDAFYDALVDACAAKYGAYSPDDKSKRLIVWVDSEFRTATLMELSAFEGDFLQLDVSL